MTKSKASLRSRRRASLKRPAGTITAAAAAWLGSDQHCCPSARDTTVAGTSRPDAISRSSALASKATGFPIAKIAAKLAVGYTLDELKNDITGGVTPASFEPTIDYVVTKVPRFTFEKFPEADNELTTQMKSVGEVMAIGRTFKESLQKAVRSLEVGHKGFESPALADEDELHPHVVPHLHATTASTLHGTQCIPHCCALQVEALKTQNGFCG